MGLWVSVGIYVIILTVFVLGILYLCRPRGRIVDKLGPQHLTENEQSPRVAWVVVAPKEEDGVNQYSITTISAYCKTMEYDFFVVTRGDLFWAMERMLAYNRYDYIIGSSNRLVITSLGANLEDILRNTVMARAMEYCYTGYFCANIAAAVKNLDLGAMLTPIYSKEFVIVNAKHPDTRNFLRKTESSFSSEFKNVEPLPFNLIHRRDSFFFRRGTGDAALLGYVCQKSATLKEVFDTAVSFKAMLPTLEDIDEQTNR